MKQKEAKIQDENDPSALKAGTRLGVLVGPTLVPGLLGVEVIEDVDGDGAFGGIKRTAGFWHEWVLFCPLPGRLLVIDDFYCFFKASMLAAQVVLKQKEAMPSFSRDHELH